MHQSRLVGGLACAGALLTLLVVPTVLLAEPLTSTDLSPSATPSPSASATTPAATPSPQPAASSTTTPAKQKPTRRQRRLRRIKRQRLLVVEVARRQLGIPYVWGGASRRGFDCSGLSLYVYKRLGIDLAHGATMQARRGKHVSLRELRLGDLVFFGGPNYYHHVGIYIGGGRMIHAPRPGLSVRISRPHGPDTARRLLHL